MKITRLIMKNFEAIKAALNKYEIDLNFNDMTNLITVIIGKMGSGKTTILGHLQPFANYGSIDIRNQDDQIIFGKEGLKKLWVTDNENTYIITHKYLVVKDRHTVKSFIEKNGEELNPNGNQSSFKTIIEIEFGIDQSYLAIMRLGANVQNLINMSSTERKRYIGNLLKDVEFYNLFNKIIKEDYRELNAHLNMLANKLNSLSSDKLDDMNHSLKDYSSRHVKLSHKKDKLSEKYHSERALLTVLLNGMNIDDYISLIEELKKEYNNILKDYEEGKDELDSINSKFNIFEVSKRVGTLESDILKLKEELIDLDSDYNNYKKQLSKIEENLKIIHNVDHIKTLKENYDNLIKTIDNYESELEGFECDMNSMAVRNIINEITMFSMQISDLLTYDKKVIKTIYKSDSSILQIAKKKQSSLTGKKINLQKSINNIKYIEKYEPTELLYLPPMCPTSHSDNNTCPYFRTHPIHFQNKSKNEFSSELEKIQNQIDLVDIEIYKYSEFPLIYNKIKIIKGLWKELYPKLRNLNILIKTNLFEIISMTGESKWYNYDKLIGILELCEKREKYYELTEKIQSMKAELNSLNKYDIDSLNEKSDFYKCNLDEIYSKISLKESKLKEYNNELEYYKSIYLKLSEFEILKNELHEKKNKCDELEKRIGDMDSNLSIIYEKEGIIETTHREITIITNEINILESNINKLNAIINDIDYTRKEFDEASKKEIYLKLMIEASSSKEGLPLIFIRRFITSTKDIINDMLYEVFNGSIEIIDFIIEENEFSIPYYSNGVKVDDVLKASQGEQSIISIALSFALMQKFTKKWNIPLLDEPDGPLYKSDRSKFLSILFNHIKAIGSKQVFIISHNNTFDGYPVNVLMTSDEIIDSPKLVKIMKV